MRGRTTHRVGEPGTENETMQRRPTTTIVRRFLAAFHASDPRLRDRVFRTPAPWHEPAQGPGEPEPPEQEVRMRVFGAVQSLEDDRVQIEVLDVLEEDLTVQWYVLAPGTADPGYQVVHVVGCRVSPDGLGPAWASEERPREGTSVRPAGSTAAQPSTPA